VSIDEGRELYITVMDDWRGRHLIQAPALHHPPPRAAACPDLIALRLTSDEKPPCARMSHQPRESEPARAVHAM
jgi:hypothetical protein